MCALHRCPAASAGWQKAQKAWVPAWTPPLPASALRDRTPPAQQASAQNTSLFTHSVGRTCATDTHLDLPQNIPPVSIWWTSLWLSQYHCQYHFPASMKTDVTSTACQLFFVMHQHHATAQQGHINAAETQGEEAHCARAHCAGMTRCSSHKVSPRPDKERMPHRLAHVCGGVPKGLHKARQQGRFQEGICTDRAHALHQLAHASEQRLSAQLEPPQCLVKGNISQSSVLCPLHHIPTHISLRCLFLLWIALQRVRLCVKAEGISSFHPE